MDPLDSLAWGLAMVKSDHAREVNAGDTRVLVGILDSGIDASHPDLAGQLETGPVPQLHDRHPGHRRTVRVRVLRRPGDRRRQRPRHARRRHRRRGGERLSASPASRPACGSSASAAARTAATCSCGPVTNALTYGADIGVDVINMSFYVDPWLYNCTRNPADSPEDQLEQRTIIEAMNRALDYAHSKDVTLVGSLGNNHEDLGHPRTDFSSPDFPPGTAYPRPIDNATCWRPAGRRATT